VRGVDESSLELSIEGSWAPKKGKSMFRPTFSLVLSASLLVFSLIDADSAKAYMQYSANKDATNCAACHGDFRASPYESLVDGQSWDSDLMSVHSGTMLNGDCLTCHSSGPRFPVVIGSSAGGTGLDPFACAGCHGRMEDGFGEGSLGYGAGLRQSHWQGGIQICLDCHFDANPNNYVPADESFLPVYYSDNDAAHPLIPSDPCNPQADGFPEDYAGGPEGLDNDGNGLYDESDLIACPEPAQMAFLLPGFSLLLCLGQRRHRNRAR
jgi:hypothetical protein